MDRDKVKIIIKEWLKIEEDLTNLKEEHKEINKRFKEEKKKLLEQQKQMQMPILQLMNEIDTESINLSEHLVLKTKPVTKTTGLTKPHIKERLDQYFSSSRNSYATLLSHFAREKKVNVTFDEIIQFLNENTSNYSKITSIFAAQYKVHITKEELTEFIDNHLKDESEQVFTYVVDISARKEFLEEENLKLTKKRGKKTKN